MDCREHPKLGRTLARHYGLNQDPLSKIPTERPDLGANRQRKLHDTVDDGVGNVVGVVVPVHLLAKGPCSSMAYIWALRGFLILALGSMYVLYRYLYPLGLEGP